MDASLSSSFLASSLSNLRTKSSRSSRPAPPLNSFLYNPFSRASSFSLPSSRGGSISRKLYQVRATSLKEKDEKVMVEESFQAKTLLETEGKEMDAELSGNESGIVERWVIKFEQGVNVLLTESVIKILDALYRDRHYARFFVLETIARVPYFAFISVLHMYESFGWWRRADYLKVHFAESWNELHHLLIMEELGGNAFWFDRFLAQHIAIFYYFMTAFMYTLSPRMACYVDFGNNQCPIIHISERELPKEGRTGKKMKDHFSECVEKHAYSTYDKFLKLQGEELKMLPAPQIAIKYYMNEDLYLFDEFQTSRTPNTRRPKIENLYDVFVNIRDDEGEHCKTMKACQTHGNLRSPHSTQSFQEDDDSGCQVSEVVDCEGFADCVKKSLTPRG